MKETKADWLDGKMPSLVDIAIGLVKHTWNDGKNWLVYGL